MPYSNTTPTYRIPYNSQGEISSGISNKRQSYIIDSQLSGAARLIGSDGIMQEGAYISEFNTATFQDAVIRVTVPQHDMANFSGVPLLFNSTPGTFGVILDSSSGISDSYVTNPVPHEYGVVIGTGTVGSLPPQAVSSKIAQLLDPDTGLITGFQTYLSGLTTIITISKEDLIPVNQVLVGIPNDWLGDIPIPGSISGPGRVTLRPTATNYALEAMIRKVYVATNDVLIWDNIPANTRAWLYAQTKEESIYQSNEFSSLAYKQVATTWNTTGITPENGLLLGIATTSLTGLGLNIGSGVSDNTFSHRPIILPYDVAINEIITLINNFSGLSANDLRGYSGFSGYSGYSGPSGYSGYSGSGQSGYSGFGFSGYSGYSGFSGVSGKSGTSGYSGQSGYSGFSGYSGYSGAFCTNTLYFSFTVNFSSGEVSSSGIAYFFALGTDILNPYFRLGYDFANQRWVFYSGVSAQNFYVSESLTASTDYRVDLTLSYSSNQLRVTPRFDFTTGTTYIWNNPGTNITQLNAWNFGEVYVNDTVGIYDLDNFNVSALSINGNEVFSCDFSSGPVPPFDSLTGTGFTVSGGVAHINSPTALSYVTKNFSLSWQYGLSGYSGYSGYSGANPGASGYSGYSGPSGYSGYSGANPGASGYSGYSGFSGANPGASGYSGYSGYSGSGLSGYSGYSGKSGYSGYSGISGYSGYSGYSGPSGYSGYSGPSGHSGSSGYSGYSGPSGYSGYSGANPGASGYSGYSGYSGANPGASGYSGFGTSGYSGQSGYSGKSGFSGKSGYSGFSGSGTSGYSGYSGNDGSSGYSGYSGDTGVDGFSGYSGYSGAGGSGSGSGNGLDGVNLQVGTQYYVDSVLDKGKVIVFNNTANVYLPSLGTVVDSYSNKYANNFDQVGNSGSFAPTAYGQSFTPSLSGTLTRARFWISQEGSPSGTCVAKLYSHSGTYGTSSVPNILLATSDTVNLSSIPLSPNRQYIYFNFSTGYSLVAGTPYCISLEYGGSTIIDLGTDGGGVLGHSGNAFWNFNPPWEALPLEDVIFDVEIDATVVDSYDSSHYNNDFLLYLYEHEVGQSFTSSENGTLSRAGFYLQRSGSNTKGPVYAKLYSHTGTYGTSSVPGDLLATSDPVEANNLPTSHTLDYFNFSTPYSLTSGTQYCLSVAFLGGDSNSNWLNVGYDGSSPSHSGNAFYSSSPGLAWIPVAGEDTIFAVEAVTEDYQWFACFQNINSGTVTIQPPFSSQFTIDGASSMTLAQNEGVIISATNKTNYFTERGKGGSQSSGYSGYSGLSGYSGFSGKSGYSGFSGSGVSGYSGYSGISGYSGFSGKSGYSGYSGQSGYSGYSGQSGYSGYSGANPGASGYSGYSGPSGYSGYSGISGYSGYSGSGLSGYSGYSGYSGVSGYSGYSGFSGANPGASGYSGYSGISGYSGFSGTSGYSGYSGSAGSAGPSGYSGYSGQDGLAASSGYSGYSGLSGYSGYSGPSGYSGYSGYSGSGLSGYSGYSGLGLSGYSGYSGPSGYSGYSGPSGYSGYSGPSGYSGYSGISGYSGYSGAIGIRGFTFANSTTSSTGISNGKIPGYFTTPYNGIITGWTINATSGLGLNNSGTPVTIRFWRTGNGTRLPLVQDVVNPSGISLLVGTHVRSNTTDSFATTAATIGDVWATEVSGLGGIITDLSGSLEITPF